MNKFENSGCEFILAEVKIELMAAREAHRIVMTFREVEGEAPLLVAAARELRKIHMREARHWKRALSN